MKLRFTLESGLSSWDFRGQHLSAKFGPESTRIFEANKIVFHSPAGWRLSENITMSPINIIYANAGGELISHLSSGKTEGRFWTPPNHRP